MDRLLMWSAAFAAGFAITGIEIALGRLLAPFFGSGLAVWAFIIASVISALALGYPLGGALADRRPGLETPLVALGVGGGLGALMGVGAPVLLPGLMEGVGMDGAPFWGRLTLTLAAFALPCISLACVSPAVLRATLRARETAGRDAGVVYALGSVGSVLGILLPALWWIPELGLRATFLVIGLVALSPVVVAVVGGRLRAGAGGTLFWLMALGVPHGTRPAEPGRTILFDGDSPIQHVRVEAADTAEHRRRWLHLSEGWAIHSSFLEPELATGDVWDWMALSSFKAEVDDGTLDVLIVGLAAGTVSNLLSGPLEAHLPELHIRGVEIDPLVVQVADSHLGLNREYLDVFVADGRSWLRAESDDFDLIILDAYAQPTIPAHLATLEFFEEVEEHLSPGGLAVLNVFAPAQRSPLLDGLVATWTAVFPESYTVEGPAVGGFRSRLLLGGPSASRSHTAPPLTGTLARSQRWMASHTAPTTVFARLPPWTDDRSPIERMTDRAFRQVRDSQTRTAP